MQSLFTPPPRPSARYSKFATSALLHVSVVALVMFLSQVVFTDDEQMDWSRFRVEPVPYRLTEPVFFSAPPKTGASGARVIVAHKTERPGQLLITAEHLPDAKLPKTAPPSIHWSSDAAPRPKNEIVNPGRREPAPSPKSSAPATVAATNRESTAATVNIALPPANSNQTPALPVSNGATSPIQTPDATGSRAGSFDTAAGQPVDVLSLGVDRTAKRYVEIPFGLQNAPAHMAGANGLGTGPGSGASSRGNGSTAGAATSSGETASATQSPAPLSELIQLQHPATGNFDVVITQTSDTESAAPPAARLTGAPVYRVYLPVGDKQEWLLEFCASNKPSSRDTRFEIFVGDEGPVNPPYPLATAIPTRFATERRTTASVLRASITSAGAFRDVRAIGSSLVSDLLLRLMSEWRFRPATRNAKPIDVDVLLIIPPSSE